MCGVCRAPEGQPANAQMAAIFQPLLQSIFVQAYTTAQRALDAYNQLAGLLDLWAARSVYPAAVVEGIRGQMMAQVCHGRIRPAMLALGNGITICPHLKFTAWRLRASIRDRAILAS